jgi:hypothetical protein
VEDINFHAITEHKIQSLDLPDGVINEDDIEEPHYAEDKKLVIT